MSRTFRKVLQYKKDSELAFFDRWRIEEKTVDDSLVKHRNLGRTPKKLKPYSKDGRRKFTAETYMVEAPGRERKLKIKNANRSLKKAERMRLKHELRKELE